MAKFYQVRIGTIYLTSNGLANGIPAKIEIPNLEDLLVSIAGNVQFSADGGAVSQFVTWTKGKVFEIRVSTLFEAQWNALVSLVNNALNVDGSFAVIGTGDIGDFTVQAKPFPNKPFSAASFRSGRIKDITFRFVTV
ncbi:MAG: hypothetical protein LUM44_09695 [Pyrinomonadaceae bacterium]|nr:hypothetical protein [Pyrinomonadaceae bacterium]